MGVLVSTTVIEVGVDVPNASLMVIEHSERFGLSQLHQLRGRVGRVRRPPCCCCIRSMTMAVFPKPARNACVPAETNDGFEIARRDLEIRALANSWGTSVRPCCALPIWRMCCCWTGRESWHLACWSSIRP